MLLKRLRAVFEQKLIQFAIRFGWLKESRLDAAYLKQQIGQNLPETIELKVPSGEGQLRFLEFDIDIGQPSPKTLQFSFLGEIEIRLLNQTVYRVHLDLHLQVMPSYCPSQKRLSFTDMSIRDLRLIQDDYALIQDGMALIQLFIPNSLSSIVRATMAKAFEMMAQVTQVELQEYISLYLDGSKQKVLDYHRQDIECYLQALAQDGFFDYTMDSEDPEERVFIQFGKQVYVEERALIFSFRE
ncbi:hypothetical protein [Algicola sagamiensis]|uniref:hypothetical protein n=1 Tax=Algicola sagamiensis TaxID=163869 RepID=UPI000375F253|nr:hypothetical protein [Algicola sagamiensis]